MDLSCVGHVYVEIRSQFPSGFLKIPDKEGKKYSIFILENIILNRYYYNAILHFIRIILYKILLKIPDKEGRNTIFLYFILYIYIR